MSRPAAAAGVPVRQKYHAVKGVIDGHVFDSEMS